MEERDLFDKSLNLVKEAMKNVLQEVLIVLPDKTSHIVYITDLKAKDDGGIEVGFNTPSEDRKEELYPHVVNCIKAQIEEVSQTRESKVIKWW